MTLAKILCNFRNILHYIQFFMFIYTLIKIYTNLNLYKCNKFLENYHYGGQKIFHCKVLPVSPKLYVKHSLPQHYCKYELKYIRIMLYVENLCF